MNNLSLPVLPLRDIVVFPGMVAPLFVGRKQSVNALNHAVSQLDAAQVAKSLADSNHVYAQQYYQSLISSGVMISTDQSIFEAEPNNSFESATFVSRAAFASGTNPDVEDDSLPWASISASLNPQNDYDNSKEASLELRSFRFIARLVRTRRREVLLISNPESSFAGVALTHTPARTLSPNLTTQTSQ